MVNQSSSKNRAETAEVDALTQLLTFQFEAVSQQFFHMLLLRAQGHEDVYKRIKEVDDLDFPNAMRVIDLLLQQGADIEIGRHLIAPAYSLVEILGAEYAREVRFEELFGILSAGSEPHSDLVREAEAPRKSYRVWLKNQLRKASPLKKVSPFDPCLTPLFNVLLRLMEQTLVRAFLAWHDERPQDANTAWQMSVAAMRYLTALVPFCGRDDPDWDGYVVERQVFTIGAAGFDADVDLINHCLETAQVASEASSDARACKLCADIAQDCERLRTTKSGHRIQARMGSSNTFNDFFHAMRFVRS